MKRFVAAAASVLFFLLADTASAQVPGSHLPAIDGPVSGTASGGQPAVVVPPATPPGTAPGTGLVPGEVPAPAPGDVTSPSDLAPVPGDLAWLRGLPGDGAELLSGAPVDPAGAVVPAPIGPVEPFLPAPDRPPEGQPAPARTPERRAAATVAPVRPVVEPTAFFPGLAASGHAGYATGTVIHADALEAGGTRLADVEVAFSGATFTSGALGSAIPNEMARIVAPTLGAGAGYGRGSGLEIGAAVDASGENQVVLGKAEAKAPPSTTLVSEETGPVDVDPAAVASLLRGQAQSRAVAACTTGVDLAFGLGYAADVGLLELAANEHLLESTATAPARAVSQSTSRTRLVPQQGASGPIAKFGLQSETRQTIAPVTFFDGTPNEFTLEFGGEFVLRATADGKSGSVFYGPGSVEPETPLLRVLNKAGEVIDQLTTQEIFGKTGIEIEIADVAEIAVGEDPRAIGGDSDSAPTETATLASGAVDVARVRLLDQGLDIRVGHLEAATAVPAGGIECGIGIAKGVDREVVKPGEEFTWTVTVSNPNDCVLRQVKVVDTISTTPGILYSILSSDPKADSTTANSLTWNDIGPINPGQKKDLLIRMRVTPDSGGGRFLDEAVATGVCGPAEAGAGVGVPLEARVTLNLPEVVVVLGAPLRAELPRTGGGLVAALPALGLVASGLLVRGVARRGRGRRA